MSEKSSNPVVKYPARKSESGELASGAEDAGEIERRRVQQVIERQKLKEQMDELKTEQLRRQLQQMKDQLDPPRKNVAPSDAPEGEAMPEAAVAPRSGTTARAARMRARHYAVIGSFVACVVLPVLVTGWYLWTRAEDRYASYAGFSVRTEEIGSALELLGGVAEMTGSSSSDTDILYQYIQSQELVAKVDQELDLRTMWSRPGWSWFDSDDDPVFAYHPPGTIEDLTDYWSNMVKVYSDSGTGLVDLEVQAFRPEDAQAIAQMIYDESSDMINRISAIAREDATRYAREELDRSVERLKAAREATTRFRNRTQIVDPAASIQSQMGILSSLQAQLAQTLIDIDILRQTASDSDPRLTQLERRADVIEERMVEERQKLGIGSAGAGSEQGTDAFADLVGEYERLMVDQQFAEQSYTAALAAYDSALAEAQRQTRYLAAHVQPTRAEVARFPDRIHLLILTAAFCLLGWAMLVLLGYSIRDRR